MKRLAIIVATQYGQTAKIADRLDRVLSDAGALVQTFVVRTEHDLSGVSVAGFDGVLIGAPVYAGRFSAPLLNWTKRHAEELNRLPVAFFTVSLNAADTRPKARQEDMRLIAKFLEQTGLRPLCTKSLIGALHYREYGFLKRWLLRRISGSAGGPTDTSRDHELTDWDAVEAFARDFLPAFTSPKTTVPA